MLLKHGHMMLLKQVKSCSQAIGAPACSMQFEGKGVAGCEGDKGELGNEAKMMCDLPEATAKYWTVCKSMNSTSTACWVSKVWSSLN